MRPAMSDEALLVTTGITGSYAGGVEYSTKIEFWMSTYIQVVIAGLQVSSRMLMKSSTTAVTGLR